MGNCGHTWRDAPAKNDESLAISPGVGAAICFFLEAAADASTSVGMRVLCVGSLKSELIRRRGWLVCFSSGGRNADLAVRVRFSI